jgi:hypothetical protein
MSVEEEVQMNRILGINEKSILIQLHPKHTLSWREVGRGRLL